VYWHEFVARNKGEYVELYQYDLPNCLSDYRCYPLKLNHGTVEFEMGDGNIKLRITKLKDYTPEKGEVSIILAQAESGWNIVIKQGGKNTIIDKNFKQVFFGDLDVEILFK
jgi:hypothetical protein